MHMIQYSLKVGGNFKTIAHITTLRIAAMDDIKKNLNIYSINSANLVEISLK